MRSLVLLLLVGCSTSPCDGLAGACLDVQVRGQVAPIDELDLLVTGARMLSAREGDGKTIALPARFAALLPDGDGPFLLQGVGASRGVAVAYGEVPFALPPLRQSLVLTLSPLDIADGGTPPDLGGFHVGADLSTVPDLSPPPDLAGVDLAGVDLASAPVVAPDLAGAPDLAPAIAWHALGSGTTVDLHGIWGDGAGNLFAVGDHGTIRASVNNGANWSSRTSGVSTALRSVWGSGIDDLWFAGDSEAVYESTDSGSTWAQPFADSNPSDSFFAFWESSDGYRFAVGSSGSTGMVFSICSGCVQWFDEYPTNPLFAVWGSGQDVYQVGAAGVIRHSNDGGDTFKERHVTPAVTLSGVWGVSDDHLWTVGDQGTILVTTDYGANWNAVASGTTAHLYSLFGASATSLFAVGAGGVILHSADAGVTWTPEPSGTSVDLAAVWGSGTDVIAVGKAGTLLKRN